MITTSVTSTPVAAATPAKKAENPAPPAKVKAGGIRGGIADSIRAAGLGVERATGLMGAQADKGGIYAMEGSDAIVGAVAGATQKVPVVGKATGLVGTLVSFYSMLQGMVFSGILRSPGAVAVDLTHVAADHIDGGKTHDGNFKSGLLSDGKKEASATYATWGSE